MPRYAEPVPAPSAKKAVAALRARTPQQQQGPQRGAIWHALQRKAAESAAPGPSSSPGASGLPASLQAGIETLSGIAMGDVRVHRNSSEPARLGALAYAQGTDIHLGPGQERHLPHEAWHVVQQKQGRVTPTVQLKGVALNESAALEAEADAMGSMALSAGAGAAAAAPALRLPPPMAGAAIQRMKTRGTAKTSEVSSATHNKHVVAVNGQAQAALDAYTNSTFVLTDADLTGPVDANDHNFLDLANEKSARKNINANVTIYLYNKRAPLPQGNGEGKPVDLAINGVATNCEIGAVKGGDDKIKITHFMKV
jgi:hypothetical protein